MKIDELGFYLKANGAICKIEKLSSHPEYDNNYDDMGRSYYPDGRYYPDEESGKDLIAYIPPALQFEILRVIEAYHTTGSFKSIIDNCYKNHLEKSK